MNLIVLQANLEGERKNAYTTMPFSFCRFYVPARASQAIFKNDTSNGLFPLNFQEFQEFQEFMVEITGKSGLFLLMADSRTETFLRNLKGGELQSRKISLFPGNFCYLPFTFTFTFKGFTGTSSFSLINNTFSPFTFKGFTGTFSFSPFTFFSFSFSPFTFNNLYSNTTLYKIFLTTIYILVLHTILIIISMLYNTTNNINPLYWR